MMLFLTIAVAALAALLFTAGGTAACAQEELRLPIVMYHDLTSNPLEQDDYTLSLEQLEQDLIAFEEHGFTPVSLSAVLRYVLDGGVLPGRPVLLVFDDGYHSFLQGRSHCCWSIRYLRSYRSLGVRRRKRAMKHAPHL